MFNWFLGKKQKDIGVHGRPALPALPPIKIGDTLEDRFKVQKILGGECKSRMGVVYCVFRSPSVTHYDSLRPPVMISFGHSNRTKLTA